MSRLSTGKSRIPFPLFKGRKDATSGSSQSPRVAFDLPPSILAGFVLTGMVTTLLGPVLPILSAKWSLSDTQAGYLFTSQFLGATMGTVVSAYIIARLGFERSLAIGFSVMAVGVAGLGLSRWPACLAAVAAYGVALGLTIPAANLFVSDRNSARPAAALNLLNAVWTLGAVLSPPLVALAIVPGARIGNLVSLAAALVIVALWIRGAEILRRHRSSVGVLPKAHVGTPPIQIVATPQGTQIRNRFGDWAWLRAHGRVFAALFFLYVGIENSLGGWVATYARRLTTDPGARWELAPSLFWGSLIFGRILAPKVLQYVCEANLVVSGLLLAALGFATLLVSKSEMIVLGGVALAALGLSPVFPITIAALTACFGPTNSRLAAPIFAFGGLGGACLPWLVGFVSSQFDSLRVGLLIPLLSTLVMLALRDLIQPTPSERPPIF